MKKSLIYFICFCSFQYHGQQLDNNSFENWENIGSSTEEPIEWSSTKTSDNSSLNGFAPQVVQEQAMRILALCSKTCK